MLLPRRVEEVVIAVPRHLYDYAVAAVAETGVLHVAPPPSIEGAEPQREYRTFYVQVAERATRLEGFFRAIGLEPYTRGGITIEAGGWREAYEKYTSIYRDLEETFDRGVSRLQEIDSRVQELAALKAILEPVAHVDADVRRAYAETSFLGYAVGYIILDDESLVSGGLEALAAKHNVVVAVEQVDKDRAAIAVAGLPGAVAGFMQEVRRYGWSPISIPEGLPGSPKRALEAIREELSRLAEERERIVESLRRMADQLAEYYTVILAIKHAAEVLANTVRTRTLSMFRGFVDRSDRRRLEEALRRALGGAYLLLVLAVRRAEERVKPPTKVDLPWPLRAFHEIVRMYGEPDPDEIVPTIFVAVTLPLIFGLMFPDAGHGLLVLLFALLYFRKGNPWRTILAILGGVSIVTGLLAGEFFGPVVSEKIGLYAMWEHLGFHAPPLAQPTFAAESELPPAVAAELTSQLLFRIISISLWLAAFMLTLGTLLGVIDAWLKGDKEGAIASKLPAFIFFLSATLPFLILVDARRAGGVIQEALFTYGHGGLLQAIVWWGTIIGIIWKLLGEPVARALEGESPLHGLGSAFMEVYEMIAMVLGNIPSFLRILGLGLAHAGLMLGFAKLYYIMAGAGIVGLISGIIVYIIGNLMVAALEAIIALAHSIRLHFYEWFSKFYSGQGIPFQPVRLEGVRILLRPAA